MSIDTLASECKMFNYNTFNGIANVPPPVEANWPVVIRYGSFTLHNLGVRTDIIVNNSEHLRGKAFSVNRESFGNDGEIFNKRELLQTIKIDWKIKKGTRTDYLAFLDEFKVILAQENQYLEYTEGAWSRRVKATCTSYSFDENHYNIDWIPFSIVFETYKYWEESLATDQSVSAITSSTYNLGITRDGTAEARLYLTLTFTAATWVTSLNMWGVLITWPIVATDSFIFDGNNQRVTKNGNVIGFIGEIPKLKEVNNTIPIVVNGTFSYNLVATYRKTYK